VIEGRWGDIRELIDRINSTCGRIGSALDLIERASRDHGKGAFERVHSRCAQTPLRNEHEASPQRARI